MSIVTVNNVWKEYGDQVVLERVNMTFGDGEFCSIVGASGCGKTTFLRMLLSQEHPTRGTIEIDGQPLPPEPRADRGVVFQRYSVFPHMSVLANVVLGLEFKASPFLGRLFGAAKCEAEAEAKKVLEAVGLGPHMEKFPAQLSGGMQQRLAIAQALITKPKVLLLDEPFGALDPGTKADMHKLILRLWDETGMSIFMVTHDLKEGFDLGTRLIAFDKPRVDPHDPGRYGAVCTFDLKLDAKDPAFFKDVAAETGLASDPESTVMPRTVMPRTVMPRGVAADVQHAAS